MDAVNMQGSPNPADEIWALLRETDRILKENAVTMKETDRQMKETDRQMKETDRKIGELSNRFGELAEHLVAPGIVQRFNELGYHFDDIIAERVKISGGKGKILTEIDLLLENSDYSIAVEVKTRPKAGDVEHHIQRLQILRAHKDRRSDRRKIRGAIAGAVFPKEAKEATIAAGLYVIEQSGDTMKIQVPAGFVPLDL
jgi:hypothetical protein